MKFGGAAVATPEHFSRIADIIIDRRSEYSRVVIVVSAMGNTTDQLIALAKQVNPDPPRREYDMLVTVGERISIALLAMALAAKSHEAISFTGSQSGIITCTRHSDARIVDVRPHRILSVLDSGKIVIVAGFQGVSRVGEITTLGRGGSDTTAVALGVALGASRVEFFKDVPGVFSEDPKKNSAASLYTHLSHTQALEIVLRGAKVLHSRCIELAQKNNLMLHVRTFQTTEPGQQGTVIGEEKRVLADPLLYEEEC
ncbi:MAG: aspartate kinase [Parachlamydiaceae bacterium]|nr:aspartate kinase [Parachlamydiaceae bacterium]